MMKEKPCLTRLLLGMNHWFISTNPSQSVLQCKHPSSSSTKTFKVMPSAGKDMSISFSVSYVMTLCSPATCNRHSIIQIQIIGFVLLEDLHFANVKKYGRPSRKELQPIVCNGPCAT